jgi:hypothetical protein
MEADMNINEYVALAERLESLRRRMYDYDKTRDEVAEELSFIAADLRAEADRLVFAMARELGYTEAA